MSQTPDTDNALRLWPLYEEYLQQSDSETEMRRVVSRSWKEGKHYIFFWHTDSAGRDKMLWKQMVAINRWLDKR